MFICCIAVAPRDPYCAKCRTNTEQSWSLPVGAHSLQFGVNQELLAWGSESNPQLDLPITPNTEQIKQEASFRELNNLPFPAVHFSN